jgi:GNAT superfamily N-acetyltransferase
MSYTIKPAEKKHLAILSSIERDAAEMFSLEDLPLSNRKHVTTADAFRRARERGHLWIAVNLQDRPVGFLMADTVDGNLHIREMDVRPDLTRQGIGSRLLQCAIDAAVKNGHPCVTLTTFEHVAWNAPFYIRNGFSVLTEADCGRELLAMLHEERSQGLKNRVAMCRQVAGNNPPFCGQ